MALPAFATKEDLCARMGDVSDQTRALAALDDASALIRSEVSPVTWTTDGALDADRPDILVMICCRAAQRALENPLAVEETAESIGDYSDRIRYANASSDVYLTKAEKAMLRKAAGLGEVGGLGYLRVVAPAEAAASRYFPWDDQIAESDGH